MRIIFAKVNFSLSILAMLWLFFGLLEIVPFIIKIQGETDARAHASLAVFLLACATWGFWKVDHQ